ncbi:BQ2448_1951 [Microbotryum intermedium]|uniref:BQ2448_1951 protein n=1 Tax=Microbotryum intermedium TaxID=269621 RepID=A0A238F9X4_9BASI|nr:BQ2448_1951 [Microbotryum intermedium]
MLSRRRIPTSLSRLLLHSAPSLRSSQRRITPATLDAAGAARTPTSGSPLSRTMGSIATSREPKSPVSSRISEPYDLESLSPTWSIQGDTPTAAAASSSAPTFVRFIPAIEVSPNDPRSYRLVTLLNGLRALLVSDPTTDKAACALSVNIGHLSDPDDLPGLAHYCEHLLFLGTEQFPDEAEYKRYLSTHNGSSNAYTSMDETLYHFDCSINALEGGLKRHAGFFKNPLFDASCTEREVNAVDAEFRRNLQLDARRLFQLGKATSSSKGSGSVYWKFGTGSKQTLWDEPKHKGVDTRERLLEWYAKHYSANLMSLALCGNQSLDQLEMMVSREYSGIPNLNAQPNIFDAPVLEEEQLKTVISYRTIKDTAQLRIEFPSPDLRAHWSSKPSSFLSHYVGHEGPGSILAELKRRGWASSLSAGGNNGAAGFDFFRINVGLTALGLTNYKDVIGLIFEYLDILASTPPQRWAFDEMVKLGQIGWRWKENGQPTSLVKNLASRMATTLYPPEKSLSGLWYATKFDEALLRTCAGLLKMDKCRVFLGSREVVEGREWDQKERYYGTEYRIDRLDDLGIKTSTTFEGKLALPKPNPFIPENLDLVTKTPATEVRTCFVLMSLDWIGTDLATVIFKLQPVKRPTLIRQSSRSRVFHKKDDRWCIPRANAYFLLKSRVADESPSSAMKTQLLTQLVEEALAEYSYDATLAGLSYSVGSAPQGIELYVSGYSDKLPLLLHVVLTKLKGLELEGKEMRGLFDLVHERLSKAYKNARLENPSTLADARLRWLTRETYWTFEQRLDALKAITPEQVQAHIEPLLAQVRIEALIHGNLTADQAIALTNPVETTLFSSTSSTLSAEEEHHRALILPKPCNLIHRSKVVSLENVNSATSVYYQIGHAGDEKTTVTLALFAQIAKVPIFSTVSTRKSLLKKRTSSRKADSWYLISQLRTKEQLGYIVSSSTWSLYSITGFRVIVQSERSPEYLESRIETLWSSFDAVLLEMTDGAFDQQKQSLMDKKREKVKNLGGESARYWDELQEGTFDFDRRERQAQLVSTLTRTDLVEFFNTFIRPGARKRSKLSILIRSQRLQYDTLKALEKLLSSDEKVTTLLKSKPTLGQLETGIREFYPEGQDVPQNVKKEMEKLAHLPVLEGEGVKELLEQGIEEWRRGLEKAERLGPREDYRSDLEVASKL